MASENIKQLSVDTFKSLVENTSEPVLVDFWAEWCGPCKMIAPVLEEIANENSENVVIGKVNVDENKSIAEEYKVVSIPTLMFFKDGQEVERVIGFKTKKELQELLDKYK
ncbi:MAG: thioredoxin [Clostridiales bacterium]|nr:thioredoxin [Clostridiales bacterium]MCF8021110.1 thioredoxin [Clostridiales bacterium]